MRKCPVPPKLDIQLQGLGTIHTELNCYLPDHSMHQTVTGVGSGLHHYLRMQKLPKHRSGAPMIPPTLLRRSYTLAKHAVATRAVPRGKTAPPLIINSFLVTVVAIIPALLPRLACMLIRCGEWHESNAVGRKALHVCELPAEETPTSGLVALKA